MNTDLFLISDAVALAVAAAVVDVRQHRIPNWLTYTGMIAGLVLQTVYLGWRGVVSALVGGLMAGGIFLVFYLVRAMGAGDVKLMTAVGCLVRPRHAVVVLLATAIAGGVLAIIYAMYRGRLVASVRNVGSVLQYHTLSGLHEHPVLNLDNPTALRMPYGLAIAAGTLFAFLTLWWG